MDIKRDNYLRRLISKKENGFIKVITGIRRCGKSHLLFSAFRRHLLESGTDPDQIVEIVFSRFEDEKFREPEYTHSYIQSRFRSDQTLFILLDDIHLLNDAKSILNSLVRRPEADIYITDSDPDYLAKNIFGEFSGQTDELTVFPLSFSEFMSVYKGNRYDGWNEYILYGGLPAVAMIREPQQKTVFLKKAFNDFFIRDISSRHRIRNQSELGNLLRILSSSIGSMTNPKQLSDIFQHSQNISISQTTLKNYLDYLEEADLISAARRYDIRGKKYITTPLKYYFADPGLRNVCIDFRDIGENRIMENIIFNDLQIRGFQVDAGVASFSEKNDRDQVVRKQLEVDFVCNKETRRYYIQSAFSIPDDSRMGKVQEPFRRINDFFKRIIITKDCPTPYYTENGVLVMSIFDFLLNPDSLLF